MIVITTNGSYPPSFETHYSVTVNQVIMATSDDFNIITRNSWFISLLVSSNPLSRKSNRDRNHMIWNIVSTEIYTGARGGFRGGVRGVRPL